MKATFRVATQDGVSSQDFTVDVPDPAIVIPNGPNARTWESIYKPGNTIHDVVLAASKLGPQIDLILPADQLRVQGFKYGTGGSYGWIGQANVDLYGHGPTKTQIIIDPMTSTSKALVPTAKGTTNPIYLVRQIGRTGNRWRGFSLQGTDQGHPYGLWMLNAFTNAIFEDVSWSGSFGYDAEPPGETFGGNCFIGTGFKGYRLKGSGRDEKGNIVGASPFGTNGKNDGTQQLTGVYLEDCEFSDTVTSMPTFYETRDVTTVRMNVHGIPYRGINHERVYGTVVHDHPNIQIGSGQGAMHIHFKNDRQAGASFRVTEPTWSGGHPGSAGFLNVECPPLYGSATNLQKITDMTVIKNGSPMTVADTKSGGVAGKDPAKTFAWYH